MHLGNALGNALFRDSELFPDFISDVPWKDGGVFSQWSDFILHQLGGFCDKKVSSGCFSEMLPIAYLGPRIVHSFVIHFANTW